MTTSSSSWSDAQKSALVQQLLLGELSLQQACAQYGLSTDQLKDWVRIFRRSVRQALDSQLKSTLSIQGLEIDELSRGEFSGNLADISVADLVQTIHLGRKDAQITVSHEGGESHVWCQGGEIADAESGKLVGEDALFRILSIEHGSVVAHFCLCPRPRRIVESTPRLLLEALDRNDQRNRLVSRIGDSRRVFIVLAERAAQRAAELGPDALGMLSLFDGVRSIDDVIVASQLPGRRALELLMQSFEAGLLTPCPVPESPRPTAAPFTGTSSAMSYRPFVRTQGPDGSDANRPPIWLLAAGAVVCSTLGAVTAIAYADRLAAGSARVDIPVAVIANAQEVTDGPATPPTCPVGMVLIHAGTFSMGSDSNHPALEMARPAHTVSVDSFCIGAHEVTVLEYADCSNQGACEAARSTGGVPEASNDAQASGSEALAAEQCNPGKPGRERHPVNCVSHRQASSYCAFRRARLPTEAEWEFAARGTANRLFPWGNAPLTAERANACGKECESWHHLVGLDTKLQGLMYDADDGHAHSAPVGSFPTGSTREGVMDLIGNVFEWTAGGLYSYDREARTNPAGPTDTDAFVIRGGNFNSGISEFGDPALRFAMDAQAYSHGVGFRCADDPEPSAHPHAQQRNNGPAQLVAAD